MAAPSLFLRHVFGLKGSIRDNIHFIEDVTVVYPAGRNVVVYNIEQKTQRFISGSPDSNGISAIAVSANRKLIAVAEKPLGARGHTPARGSPEGGHQLEKNVTEKSIGFAESSKGGVTSAGSLVDVGAKGAVITLYDSTTLKKRKVSSGQERWGNTGDEASAGDVRCETRGRSSAGSSFYIPAGLAATESCKPAFPEYFRDHGKDWNTLVGRAGTPTQCCHLLPSLLRAVRYKQARWLGSLMLYIPLFVDELRKNSPLFSQNPHSGLPQTASRDRLFSSDIVGSDSSEVI